VVEEGRRHGVHRTNQNARDRTVLAYSMRERRGSRERPLTWDDIVEAVRELTIATVPARGVGDPSRAIDDDLSLQPCDLEARQTTAWATKRPPNFPRPGDQRSVAESGQGSHGQDRDVNGQPPPRDASALDVLPRSGKERCAEQLAPDPQ
jgi:hypothetical protein